MLRINCLVLGSCMYLYVLQSQKDKKYWYAISHTINSFIELSAQQIFSECLLLKLYERLEHLEHYPLNS